MLDIITQEEFNSFKVNEFGIKECRTGNYSQIKSFGKCCSFGKYSLFGECSSFGECCSFGKCSSFGKDSSFGERSSFDRSCSFENGYIAKDLPFIRINNIGSRLDGCIIYNFEKGIYVRSGCFFGNVDEFLAKVKETHAGTVYEKQYTLAIELAKCSF